MNTTSKKYKMQGKTADHKNAIIRSLVLELIRSERLQTTPEKGKILKSRFDKLVTKAKVGTEHSRRQVESFLRNDKAIVKLMDKLVPRLAGDNSGYTLSARTLPRKGDNAEQMIVMVKGAQLEQSKSRLEKLLEREEKPAKKASSKTTKTKSSSK